MDIRVVNTIIARSSRNLSMNSNTNLLLLNFNLLNKKNDILSFSESWLNDNNKNLYTIKGYDAFHNVRCDSRRGGGLSGYISNVFKYKVIHPFTISLKPLKLYLLKLSRKIVDY